MKNIEYTGKFEVADESIYLPIIRKIISVNWPCPDSQIPSIIQDLGWTLTEANTHIKADTHFNINWPVADFARPNGFFEELIFDISDTVAADDIIGLKLVRFNFPAVVSAVESVLGEASGTEEPNSVIVVQKWWELQTGGRLLLTLLGDCIQIRLSSKEYADVYRFEETHDMSEYDVDS